MPEQSRIWTMWQQVVRDAPVAMLLVDQQQVVRLANDQAAEIFALPPEELRTSSVKDLLCDAPLNAPHESLLRVLANPPDLDRALQLQTQTSVRLGGRVVALSVNVWRDGRDRWTWLCVTDLSERHAIERQLHDALGRMEFTAQASGSGMWVWHAHDEAIRWDRRMRDLFAFSSQGEAESVAFAQWVAMVVPEDRVAFEQQLADLVEQGERAAWVHRVIRQDGQLRWMRTSGLAERDPSGHVVRLVGVNHDVTDMMNTQTRMQRRNTLLEQQILRRGADSERISAELEAFSYAVSHDLRAPLRAIDGYSDILLKSYGERLDKQGRGFLRKSKAASQRLGVLIDDLLSLARISRAVIRAQDVDMSQLAWQVVQDLRQSQPVRRVEVTVQPDMHAVADAAMMHVLLSNLMGNAWKFTRNKELTQIEFGCQTRDGLTEFFVRDNGAGFDMAYADKLFAAFQRLHQAHEFPGGGMGLATVHRIVSRHNGGIRAVGEVGQGASFYFWLGDPEAEDRS